MRILRRRFLQFGVSTLTAILVRETPLTAAAFQSAATPEGDHDLRLLRERIVAMLAPPGSRARAIPTANRLAASLTFDGRWPDVNYEDRQRSEWKASSHLVNLVKLAGAYHLGVARGDSDAELLHRIQLALQWWLDHDLQNPNWWHNQIGVPKLLGEIALFLDDALPATLRDAIVTVMKRSDWSRWTGQNLVWGCQIQIMRGIISRDSETVAQAYTRMYEEVRIGEPLGEGIMPDFSFHQHKAQFYSGGYGYDFAEDVGAFTAFSWGTRFQVPAQNMTVYTRYLLDGIAWMLRGSLMDYSSIGRQITRKARSHAPQDEAQQALTYIAQSFSLPEVAKQLASLGVPRSNEFAALAARMNGAAGVTPLSGNRHYWCSDYMAHQRPQFFASVRMFSSRTINTELINDEGKQSHHLADGCTFIYRDGQEYLNIFPAWDWSKVPGTTAEQIDLLDSKTNPQAPTDASFVGGVSDGTYGLAAQLLHRGSLRARKAWIMFDDGFAALGTDIQCDSERPVVTCVNQCLLRGDVIDAPDHSSVWHDGFRYVVPTPQNVQLAHGDQAGRWSDIGVGSSDLVRMPVFKLSIDHGPHPRNANYSYIVRAIPSAAQITKPAVEIVSNTPSVQAVRHIGSKLLYVVFWTAGETPGGEVAADQPCLLMMQDLGPTIRVSMSNPLNQTLRVQLTVKQRLVGTNVRRTGSTSVVTVDLPDGPLAGSTVVQNFQISR